MLLLLTLFGCQKESLEIVKSDLLVSQVTNLEENNSKNVYSGTAPGDIIYLTVLERVSLDSLVQSLPDYTDLDLDNSDMLAIDSTGLNFATRIPYDNDPRKVLIFTTHGNQTYIESGFTLKHSKIENQELRFEIIDIFSELTVIIKANIDGSNAVITVIHPTNGRIAGPWWDCMVSEFHHFTDNLAGIIALSLYPRTILTAMAVKCFLRVNDIVHF